ncbi:MAG: hypothetical protein WDO19_18680 [Bacteroidota bacterium]
MKKKPDDKEVCKWIIDYLLKQPGVARAVELRDLGGTTLNATIKEMLVNGYYPSAAVIYNSYYSPNGLKTFRKVHNPWLMEPL